MPSFSYVLSSDFILFLVISNFSIMTSTHSSDSTLSASNVIFKSYNVAEMKTSEAVLAQQNHLNVDLCFVCADSQKIKLHKLIIGCADGLLGEILGKGFDNGEESTVIFPDVGGEDLITIVSAIYTGFCLVPESKVEELSGIVKMLKLPLVFEISTNDKSISTSEGSQDQINSSIESESTNVPVYEIEYVKIEKLRGINTTKMVKPLCSLLKKSHACLETTVVYKRSLESNSFNRADVESKHCEIEPRNEVIDNVGKSPDGKCASVQYKLTDFPCVQCDFTSCLKEELTAHRKMVHPASKHKCDLCTKTFTRKNDLKRHMMLHSGERRYACTFCDAKFIGSGDLHKHVRIHTGERPYKCVFESCTKSFTQKGDLNKHVKIHLKLKNHKCHLCGYSCIQGSDLSNHMLTHSNSKPFPCDLCLKSFRRNNQLSIHMKRFHPTQLI